MTPPPRIERDLADVILERLETLRTEIHDVKESLAMHETEYQSFAMRTRSDIEALRPGGRAKMLSQADLDARENADLKAARDRLVGNVWKVAIGVLLAFVSGYVAHVLQVK